MADWQEVAGMDCLVKSSAEPKNCVVLFHGYGADANDLYPLEEFLNVNDDTTWLFPQGILEVIIAPGMKGRAWFEIDMKLMEQAMMRGEYRDLTQSRPQGMDNIVEQALPFLEKLQQTYKKVILGGFSQGAMLATEILLRAQKKPEGLIVLSGTLLDEVNWKSWAKDVNDIPLFQSHGNKDPLLDPRQALLVFNLLKTAGMKGKFYQFKGGHEIPPVIIHELHKFLQEHLN